jgi:hypothetical protein
MIDSNLLLHSGAAAQRGPSMLRESGAFHVISLLAGCQ